MPHRLRRLPARPDPSRRSPRLAQVRRVSLLALAVILVGGTGLPGLTLGAQPPGPVPAQEQRPNDPTPLSDPLVAASPIVLGAVDDALGQLWVPTDRPGSGSLGIPAAPWDAPVNHRATTSGDAAWWLPAGSTGTRWIPIAWAAGAGDVTLSVSAEGAHRTLASVTLHADPDPPIVIVEAPRVEQGELVVRWTETDRDGSGVTKRSVRTETALATPTGCGPFSVAEVVALGPPAADGDPADGHGSLSLGAPPASGCLRATVTLGDRVGHATVGASRPYRVAPPPPPPATKAAAPKWSGRWNLYRRSAFVTQKTFQWCVAASVQMMVNLVRHRTDRTAATQRTMIRYAQRWDNGPYGAEGGTDVTGWITALRHFGAGRYRAVGANTPQRALRIAATAMRQTGRPAGILVMEGRHAWVLHGFESRTDPRADRRAVIRAVRISGPLYPIQQKNGYDPRPNSRFTLRALERYFQPTVVGSMAGKYVVVIPSH